jgi:glycosyltransferase involved in cell wall biosynthesis
VTETPILSVVVLSYNSRHRIDVALRSLAVQEADEPYEVIVVDSGEDDCAAYVRASYPGVRLVRSETRLFPGAARNRGVRAARGRYIAFLADDCAAAPDWVARRIAKHREGFAAVGGAVTNGTRFHPIGSASYYLEYSPLLPSDRTLSHQSIPHALSYDRALFDRLGAFPEDTRAGEDTVFNKRCLANGVEVALDPRIQFAHRNPTRIWSYLHHQVEHGRALVHCVERHRLGTGPFSQRSPADAFSYLFLRYPLRRWRTSLRRIARGRPRWLPGYLVLAPLIWPGLWAAAAGAWSELQRQQSGG